MNIHSVYTKKCSNYKLKRYFCILNCIKKRKYCDFFLSCRKVSIIFRFEYQSAVDFSILKNCKLTTKPAYSKHILFSPVDLNSNLRKSGVLACKWLSYLDQSDCLFVLNIPCHAGRLTEKNQFYPGQMLAPAYKNKQ